MSASGNESIIRIKEGKTYPFRITGITELPDGTEQFVLSDPNRVKHLLEKKWYTLYNFEVGQLIICRIDKINCSGKIYIEPLHPYYKLGKEYDFAVKRIPESDKNDNRRLVVFEDIFGNETMLSLVLFSGEIQPGKAVRLKVTRIRNGKVFLSEPEFDIENSGLKIGEEYAFSISDFIDDPGNRSFFIITAGNGSKFKLRSKYYEKYGLEKGQVINCRLIRKRKELFFEPRHPVYAINKRYDFEIIEEKVLPHYPDLVKKAYILRHDYGKDIILPEENVDKRFLRNNKIACVIKDIQKARLFLDCRK
jgi:hypothetical protein